MSKNILDMISSLGDTESVSDEPIDVVSRIIKEKKPVSLPGISIIEESSSKEILTKAELRRHITNILAEHDGMESNIPVTHKYWRLCNQYRGMD